jgi:transcriptional regulator with XRE-family HTH domain
MQCQEAIMLTFINEKKMENVSEFNQWLQAKLVERGWKATDLARKASLGNSTITRILDGTRNPGKDVCIAIAEVFEEEPDYVFRLAGILPDSASKVEGLSGGEVELLEMYRSLPISRKEALLSILRGLVDRVNGR